MLTYLLTTYLALSELILFGGKSRVMSSSKHAIKHSSGSYFGFILREAISCKCMPWKAMNESKWKLPVWKKAVESVSLIAAYFVMPEYNLL